MHLTTRTQLLFDEYFLDRADGVQLRMNIPVQHPEPVLVADRPWEAKGISGYHTVMREDGRFRMWYAAMMKYGLPQEGAIRLCYAESTDGLHWEKPTLNLLPFEGSTANNIVAPPLERQSQQGATVFRDARAPAEERYRLWTKLRPTDAQVDAGALQGLYALRSPDGLHWTMDADQPNPPDQMCDTQNMVFWDQRIGQYVGYTRVKETQMLGEAAAGGRASYRAIGRITSPDFRHWSKTEVVLEADEVDLQMPLPQPKAGSQPVVDVYTSCAMPYEAAQDAYLMFPSFFYHWGENAFPATLDVQLLTSRDGIRWRRTEQRQPFLRHGLDGSATSGMLFANPWLIPMGDELWLYYAATDRRHIPDRGERVQSGIFRASIRRDGFISVDADYHGGEFTTPPFTFDGQRLEVNCDGSAAGWLLVEVQDAEGRPLPDYAASDCHPVMGNSVSREVSWKHHRFDQLTGQNIRLRFVLWSMKLYAFRIAE